ncbi:MAG: acyl-CoA dehydrogenase, partial [Actinomycetota bacterium]|nr:acyl-CoA dehydrogenase [Actinomycetota bacterium]
ESAAAQIRLARAASTMRSARLMFDAAVHDLCAPLRGESYPSPATRVRIRMDCAHVVDLVKQVLALIADGAGASSHFLDSPLQRFRRDVSVLSGHILFDYDRAAELQGRMMLGVKPPAGTIV